LTNSLRIPGAADKTVIIGMNGSGKTVEGAWILSRQNFDKRPWVALDYKREEFWDIVGDPPMRRLRLGEMPGPRGLYRMTVLPGDDDRVEDWLWKVWRRGNIGLFADEVTLLPSREAFPAILRQGRSLHIPIISCTQRPVKVDRELFSESTIRIVINLDDARDFKVCQEFIPNLPPRQLPKYWSYWYDSRERQLKVLQPVPKPDSIARELRKKVPYRLWLG
jgi:hypothetical protein